MSQSNPIFDTVFLGASAYIFYQWLNNYFKARKALPVDYPWPGATTASPRIILTAIAGAMVLLAAETHAEYAFGVVKQQSTLTLLSLGPIIAAAFTEELIFRGYLVVPNKGLNVFWLNAVLFSIIFSLLHPYLWSWQNNQFQITYTLKGSLSTCMLFLNSLWFYWARFNAWNPQRSLIPCISAHLAKNIGVFIIKAFQGYISGFI